MNILIPVSFESFVPFLSSMGRPGCPCKHTGGTVLQVLVNLWQVKKRIYQRVIKAVCLISLTTLNYGTRCFAENTATNDPKRSAETFRSAMLLEDRAKWREAQILLNRIVHEQPDFYVAYAELGRCYIKTNDEANAERILNVAEKRFMSSDEAMKEIIRMRIFLESHRGHLDALQTYRRLFINRFPNAAGVKDLSVQMEDLVAIRSEESRRSQPNCPWYQLSQMPSMPLKILIGPSKSFTTISDRSLNARYVNLAKKAALAWAQATDGFLSFSFVRVGAELTCEWTRDPLERISDSVLGETFPVMNDTQRIVCRRVVIYIDESKRFSDNKFYEICLHELGHGLGLQHSTNPADVMYWSGQSQNYSPATRVALSTGDIKQVQALYAFPFIGQRVALEFATKAYIRHEYEKAYSMLTAKQQKKQTLAEFQKSMEKTSGSPIFLTVTHFDLNNGRMNFTLLGTDSSAHKLYYSVCVTWTEKAEFQVDESRRAF